MILRGSLPEDALLGSARVTMTGQSGVLVEGQHGVVELSGARIRLKTAGGIVTVIGEELRLRELSLDSAIIAGGRVMTVTYGKAEG